MQAAAQPKETSTERIMRVLDRIEALPIPEDVSEAELIRDQSLDNGEDIEPKDH